MTDFPTDPTRKNLADARRLLDGSENTTTALVALAAVVRDEDDGAADILLRCFHELAAHEVAQW
jgi:hypothetical protein